MSNWGESTSFLRQNYMVAQMVKKKSLNIVYRTFIKFWHDSDVLSTIIFHTQVPIFAIKPHIKVDFYMYIKNLVYHNASNKIIGCYTIYFFVINLFKLRHDTSFHVVNEVITVQLITNSDGSKVDFLVSHITNIVKLASKPSPRKWSKKLISNELYFL